MSPAVQIINIVSETDSPLIVAIEILRGFFLKNSLNNFYPDQFMKSFYSNFILWIANFFHQTGQAETQRKWQFGSCRFKQEPGHTFWQSLRFDFQAGVEFVNLTWCQFEIRNS